MELTFAPKGILQIDDARIVYRNFSGTASTYNREGSRKFALVIPDLDLAKALKEEGWNVKIKDPREEGDDPFITLPVKVNFNDYGPEVYLISGKSKIRLDEESVRCLDNIDIANIDMDISPYDWEFNGKTGRTAYLKKLYVVQKVDRFMDKYSDDECPF